jgi:hypothetical protein
MPNSGTSAQTSAPRLVDPTAGLLGEAVSEALVDGQPTLVIDAVGGSATLAALIDGRVALDEAQDAFNELATGRSRASKILVSPAACRSRPGDLMPLARIAQVRLHGGHRLPEPPVGG